MSKKSLPYLLAYFSIFVLVGILLLSYQKGDLHILLNSNHSSWQDAFFRYYTRLAEWPFYLVAAAVLFFAKFRWWTFFYGICEASNAIITFIVKRICGMPRPRLFFGEDIASQVPLVDGVSLRLGNSFPSGHTCTFFIFFTVIVILRIYYSRHRDDFPVSKKVLFHLISIVFLLLAAIGSYSRIYLSQHFLLDCFVGSIMGIVIPYLCYYICQKKGWIIPKNENENTNYHELSTN